MYSCHFGFLFFAVGLLGGNQRDNNKGLTQTAESNVAPYLSLLNYRMKSVKHKFSADYIFFDSGRERCLCH